MDRARISVTRSLTRDLPALLKKGSAAQADTTSLAASASALSNSHVEGPGVVLGYTQHPVTFVSASHVPIPGHSTDPLPS